ncbi:methylamine utilization protein [Photobacterium sp. ZSDE20]|uniref:Methylamine utilization protein n=1 Tax=Photobacterium pectinilyticum TaxID=2906793 RepID=A0ABT1MYR2_9GAMM|nr:cytochrome c peroxidase [Photobacterium sp. ZSDE20]MCQ1057625.1 methylamine utilization protein [Photobacterium sp. ZSDE20]MDD1821970.1 methylamine utilization protein [Photobacterium sp. ZSDE20]
MSINMARYIKNNKGVDKISIPFFLGIMSATVFSSNAAAEDMTYLEELGKRLYFENISLNNNMSCATCHEGSAGGTNGDSHINNTEVAVRASDGVSIGALKPPNNQYLQFLDYEQAWSKKGVNDFNDSCEPAAPGAPRAPCGGAFWNGRAKGGMIEDEGINVFAGLSSEYEDMYRKYIGPLADQAHASPFINPVEQQEPTKKSTCVQVRDDTEWGEQLYKFAWGKDLKCGKKNVDKVFAQFAVAIAAWQMSSDNNRFDSKRDIALKNDADGKFPLDGFTDQENLGHDLFYGIRGPGTPGDHRTPQQGFFGGARCAFCHQSGNDQGEGKLERYTNDRYFNIGVPRNHEIPGDPNPDDGLMFTTNNPFNKGQHKVPTLRNVDKRPHDGFVKAYTHNGWFKSLEQLVHFYNTANVDAVASKERCQMDKPTVEEAIDNDCWPEPEHMQTFIFAQFGVGNLGLTKDEEQAVVAYLKTLSDQSHPTKPSRYKLHIMDPKRMQHSTLGGGSHFPQEPEPKDPFADKFSFGRF